MKDDGTLYLPRRGAGPWRRYYTHTTNVYKFSTIVNNKEYYLVKQNGSNRVCGKTHFFRAMIVGFSVPFMRNNNISTPILGRWWR
ncbi:hypothetical protein GBAR_LOCUS20775 [Geodia barretti]|nr:hypothetical protein GBAR_LOCUS20775 [Geodia barretti]